MPCGSGAQVEKDFEVNNEMENDCKLSDSVINAVEPDTEITVLESSIQKKEPLVVTVPLIKRVLQEMGISVADNVITGETEIKGMGNEYSRNKAYDILTTLVRDKLVNMGVNTSRSRIIECITTIADINRFNPARDMLLNTE